VNAFAYLQQVLTEKYDIKPEAIKPEATLEELGLDSLSVAELLFDVGDKFGIDVPDDRTDFKTLGEASAIVDELIQAKGS
jgi:acyl carrier protein